MKWVVCLTILLVFVVYMFFNIHITTRADNTILSTPTRSFYIPANSPLKIYSFDPHPQDLKQQIDQLISSTDSTYGIYIKNLSTGQEIIY